MDLKESNRRQHERVRTARIAVRIPSMDKMRQHYLRDLSEGGLFVRTDKTLPLQSAVEVELTPPGAKDPLLLRGKVVRLSIDEAARRLDAVGMGVEFEALAPEVRARLDAVIDECRKSVVPEPVAQPPGGDASELLVTRRENADLRAQLSEALGKIEAYQVEVGVLEGDEAASRALAERLATEKRNLEQQFKSAAVNAGRELEQVRQELTAIARLKEELPALKQALQRAEKERDETREEAAVLQRALADGTVSRRQADEHLASLRHGLEEAQVAQRDLRAEVARIQVQLEDERLRADRAVRDADEQRAQAERARSKEREVRRLLAVVSGKPELPSEPEPSPPPARPAATPRPVAAAPVPPAPVPPPPLADTLAMPWDMEPKPPESAEDAGDVDVDVQESASLDPPNPFAVPQESADDFDVHDATYDELPDVADPARRAKAAPAAALSFADFEKRLRAGEHVRRLPKFNLHTPTDPTESLVCSLLESAETLDEIKTLTRGRVSEEKILRVIFAFLGKVLVEVSSET